MADRRAGGWRDWRRWALIGGSAVAAATATGAWLYVREQRTEQAPYRIVRKEGDIEIRAYPALLVAETADYDERDGALNSGFRRLAAYIFGKGRDGGAIAMTAPVIQDRLADRRWRTRFVMPASESSHTLPPMPAGVSAAELPAREVAAIRFSGSVDDATLNDKRAQLEQWLARYGYAVTGAAEYAFYNSPMVLPSMRRNEVLIPVSAG